MHLYKKQWRYFFSMYFNDDYLMDEKWKLFDIEEQKNATSIKVIGVDYRNANGFIFSSISLNERYENKKIVREI